MDKAFPDGVTQVLMYPLAATAARNRQGASLLTAR